MSFVIRILEVLVANFMSSVVMLAAAIVTVWM